MSNGIVTPDGFTWLGAAGVSDLNSQTPMQTDDIFGIGSITKTFTAATVLKLTERGELSLDDILGQWLPDIAAKIPDSDNVTIRQLLDGSSGIVDLNAKFFCTERSNFYNCFDRPKLSYGYFSMRSYRSIKISRCQLHDRDSVTRRSISLNATQ
jgi:CubicO group peptidase (beta-lactamase class C family)